MDGSAALSVKNGNICSPLSVHEVPENVYFLHHWHAMHVFLRKLSQLKYSYIRILYYLFSYSFNRYFNLRDPFHVEIYAGLSAGNRSARQAGRWVDSQ